MAPLPRGRRNLCVAPLYDAGNLIPRHCERSEAMTLQVHEIAVETLETRTAIDKQRLTRNRGRTSQKRHGIRNIFGSGQHTQRHRCGNPRHLCLVILCRRQRQARRNSIDPQLWRKADRQRPRHPGERRLGQGIAQLIRDRGFFGRNYRQSNYQNTPRKNRTRV